MDQPAKDAEHLPITNDHPTDVLLPGDSDPSVKESLGPPGGTLLVAFGGLLQPQGRRFEFDRLTGNMPRHRILIRDHERCWYQKGIRGIASTSEGVEDYLRETIARAAPDRVIFIGASAGGFAALFFGSRLGADETHAFAPQTFIGTSRMRARREPRWRNEGKKVDAVGTNPSDADLSQVLARATRTAHHVWYCARTEEDVVHASNVASCPGVVLHCLPDGEHLVVTWLRDHHFLHGIVRRALDGEPAGHIDVEVRPVFRSRVRFRTLARRRARIVKAAILFRLGRSPRQYF